MSRNVSIIITIFSVALLSQRDAEWQFWFSVLFIPCFCQPPLSEPNAASRSLYWIHLLRSPWLIDWLIPPSSPFCSFKFPVWVCFPGSSAKPDDLKIPVEDHMIKCHSSLFVLPQEPVLVVVSSENTSSVLNTSRVAESPKNCFVPQMFNDPKLISHTFSEVDFTVGWD